MPGKNLAALSFSTFLSLVSHAVVAATTAAAFLSTAFLLLTHSWEEIKPAAMTADQPAPTATIAATADQPAPAATIAMTADQPAPADTIATRPSSGEQRDYPRTVSQWAGTVSKAAASGARAGADAAQPLRGRDEKT